MSKRLFIATILISCLCGINPALCNEPMIKLPDPQFKGSVSVEETLLKRRSIRSFQSKELTTEQISQLLWAAQGITQEIDGHKLRTAPSAGALYPIETYLISKDGLFKYFPKGHKMLQISTDDIRTNLVQAAYNQGFISEAPVSILLCAVYERLAWRYHGNATKYAHIEVGHIAQNIHLQAVALGLGSVPIGAFDANKVKKDCTLPNQEEPIYIIPIGYPQ